MSKLICASDDLVEGGNGVRFTVRRTEGGTEVEMPAFAIRFDGTPHAYLNRCAHIPVELDWQPGRFFDDSGLYLICATHGAIYEPDSGTCVGGPCRGSGLKPLEIEERDGAVYLKVDT